MILEELIIKPIDNKVIIRGYGVIPTIIFCTIWNLIVLSIVFNAEYPAGEAFTPYMGLLIMCTVPSLLLYDAVKALIFIKGNKLIVVEDRVAFKAWKNSTAHSSQGRNRRKRKPNKFLIFEKHTKKYERAVPVSTLMYGSTKIGDTFYLVYLPYKKAPIGVYPEEYTILSEELIDRIL